MENLPYDLKYVIGRLLSDNDLLKLWQTCRCYRDFYLSMLKERRLAAMGIELSYKPDLTRLLTISQQLQPSNNILQDSTYYLVSDLKAETTDPFFIVRGTVIFNIRGYKIHIWRGHIFRIEGRLTVAGLRVYAYTQGNIDTIPYNTPISFKGSIENITRNDTLPGKEIENKDLVTIFQGIKGGSLAANNVAITYPRHKLVLLPNLRRGRGKPRHRRTPKSEDEEP